MLPQQAPAKAATPKRGKGGTGDGKVLAQFCRDLCAEARAGRLDPVRRAATCVPTAQQLPPYAHFGAVLSRQGSAPCCVSC